MVRNFKAATATIPIVGDMADPIAWGIVDSLARPGGNITGVSNTEGEKIMGKRLGLLRELIPGAARVGYLASRDVADSTHGVDMREAVHQAGLSLVGPLLETISEAEYRRVFELMTRERADAFIVRAQGDHVTYDRLIIELAEKSRLPALFPYPSFAELGGLIAYGNDAIDLYRRAAGYRLPRRPS